MSTAAALHEQLQRMKAKRTSTGSIVAGSDIEDDDAVSADSVALSSAPSSPVLRRAVILPKLPDTPKATQETYADVPLSPASPKPVSAPAVSHSPERSPIHSPIHSPIRSPIRSPPQSPVRSPIVSRMQSPIVSPTLSSPTRVRPLSPAKPVALSRVDPESDSEDEVEDLQRPSVALRSPEFSPVPTPATTITTVNDDKSSFSSVAVDDDDGHQPSLPPSTTVKAFASHETEPAPVPATYPPPPPQSATEFNDAVSVISEAASTMSRKARPESQLIEAPSGPLILGIALVDFHHIAGPQIEFFEGELFMDEEVIRILPFLALPDGAHLQQEDYSYFHLVPMSSPNPTTVFGISCNRQIKTSELLHADEDVKRSTVQKALVVLASKPLFGPIRDRLGVVTQAFFAQRNFRETEILSSFFYSLEGSLRLQLTESALYMGTHLRELVHKFRHRTLILLRALMLQKRIMFYGHPVERLCTYQYSLVSLVPGLLQTLDDAGSPPLASRAPTLSRPTSLQSSNRKSLLAYLGLPLDLFGKDSFFQPYLPLQQLDLLAETGSWLVGSTNAIVGQQRDIQLYVNVETAMCEFRDPKLERLVALTPADRKWIDEIVNDVNSTWNEDDPSRPIGMSFKGSEDYIRSKFEEYISAALSSVKYADFIAKQSNGAQILSASDTGANLDSLQDFGMPWVAEFRRTNAFEVWERVTDPTLFDIVEAKHPCPTKVTAVSDIGLRLQEGIRELQLEQQLAPTREAITNALSTGSANLFKAVEGVRGRWAAARQPSSTARSPSTEATEAAEPPKEAPTTSPPADDKAKPAARGWPWSSTTASSSTTSSALPSTGSSPSASIVGAPTTSGMRPLSLLSTRSTIAPPEPAPPLPSTAAATVSAWGQSVGSFFSTRAPRFSLSRTNTAASGTTSTGAGSPVQETTALPRADTPPQVATRMPRDEMSPHGKDDDFDEVHMPGFGQSDIVKPAAATVGKPAQ